MKWLLFCIRWWRWFLCDHPAIAKMYLGPTTYDSYTKLILTQRWLDEEPRYKGKLWRYKGRPIVEWVEYDEDQ